MADTFSEAITCEVCFHDAWEPIETHDGCAWIEGHEGPHAQCSYCVLMKAYEKLARNVIFGREAINLMIKNEWGWTDTEGGDVYPREPQHSCTLARAGPSCRTCSDYHLILEGWAALNGKGW